MESRRKFVRQASVATAGIMLSSAHAEAVLSSGGYVDILAGADGKYAAAPLPFSLDALEPHIDARTVELHYNFHHKPAVTAANNAEAALAKARETGDFALVKFYEKELAFQLSSHVLHTIYWTSISGKGQEPTGELARLIDRDYGSFKQFKAQLLAATIAVEASGWGVVGFHTATGRLMTLQCENHQKLAVWGVQPILVLDVFEHAYYLKYQNRRAEYVKAIAEILNWDNAAQRLSAISLARR